MSNIVQSFDASNNAVYPVTHLRAVRDSNGTTLESMMQDVREMAVGYYECSTPGSTAAKTITIDSSVSLSTKILCKVKFVEKNTVNNTTMNINGTGAKALYYNGVRAAANNSWYPNEVVDLYYDGTNYQAKSCADTLEYDVSLHQTHEITEITTTTRTLVFNGDVVSSWESETPVSDSSVEGYTRSETNTGQDVDSTTVDGPNATYVSSTNKTNVVYVTTHTYTHVVNNYTFQEAVNAVPMSYRHGGLKLRFISNSDSSVADNKYVQYRLMATSFSTDEADWQGDSIMGTDRIADGAVNFNKLYPDLQSLITNISKNALFAGIATPTTNPGTPDGPVFYLASENGTYSNFGGVTLTDEVAIFSNKNGSWVKSSTGIATSAKVTELENKVQKFPVCTNEIGNSLIKELYTTNDLSNYDRIEFDAIYKNYNNDGRYYIRFQLYTGEQKKTKHIFFTDINKSFTIIDKYYFIVDWKSIPEGRHLFASELFLERIKDINYSPVIFSYNNNVEINNEIEELKSSVTEITFDIDGMPESEEVKIEGVYSTSQVLSVDKLKVGDLVKLEVSGIIEGTSITSFLYSSTDSGNTRTMFNNGNAVITQDGIYDAVVLYEPDRLRLIPNSNNISIKLSLIKHAKLGLNERVYKLETGAGVKFDGKEIFSIFDSLGASCIWQKELSKISGLSFDGELNKILSIGGRFILDDGCSEKSAFYATKYLIENFKARADNGYIFLENVHDLITGNIDDTPFFVETKYLINELYQNREEAMKQLNTEELFATHISKFQASVNSAIVAKYGTSTKALTIIEKPSISTMTVIEEVDGGEVGRYTVSISDSDTIQDILQNISVYEYVNFDASVVDSTVVFTLKTINISAMIKIQEDVDYTISDSTSVYEVGKGFISKDINEWSTYTKWTLLNGISLYSKLKGQVEYIQRNAPNSRIYFVAPTYSLINTKENQPEFYYKDGTFNTALWKKTESPSGYAYGNKTYQDLINVMKEIGNLYGITTIDIMNNGGISPVNWIDYYDYGNTHPAKRGDIYPAYIRWADEILRNL